MLKSLPPGPAGPWAKLSVWTAAFDHLRPSKERVSTLRHLPSCNSPPAREHKLPKPCANWTLSPGPHTPRKHRQPGLWGPGGDGCGEVTPKRPRSRSQGRRWWAGSLLDEGGQAWETGCPGEAAAGRGAVQAQGGVQEGRVQPQKPRRRNRTPRERSCNYQGGRPGHGIVREPPGGPGRDWGRRGFYTECLDTRTQLGLETPELEEERARVLGSQSARHPRGHGLHRAPASSARQAGSPLPKPQVM